METRNAWQRFTDVFEPDNAFAYDTVKIVRIRDRWLGYLYYTFLVVIILYIVGIVIIRDKKYMVSDNPMASFKFSLDDPAPDTTFSSYCSQEKKGSGVQCIKMVATDLVFPPDEEQSIFVTTALTEDTRLLACNPQASSCKEPFPASPTSPVLVNNIENFRLGIDHSVRASVFYSKVIGNQDFAQVSPDVRYTVAGSARTLNGQLKGQGGVILKTFPANGQPDEVSLGLLLKAAGITSLDRSDTGSGSENTTFSTASRTLRLDGLVLVVEVQYMNKYTKGNRIEYTYKVDMIPEVHYNIWETIWVTFGSKKIMRNRKGLRLMFLPAGQIFAFDFQAGLVQLTASLALLAAATAAVDFIALHLLPHHQHYEECKIQKSPDFSDLTDHINEVVQRDKTRAAKKKTVR